MARRDFVDPGPFFEEKMRELEEQVPPPRSGADQRRFEIERRRLIRDASLARRTAMWFAPCGQEHLDS